MLRQDKYAQYFILDTERLLVRRDLLRRRKEFKRGEIWLLMRIMESSATEAERNEFNFGVRGYQKMRSEFNHNRKTIFASVSERDGERCAECGSQEDLTLDHILPLARGGSNKLDNLQILCRVHNSSKGAR